MPLRSVSASELEAGGEAVTARFEREGVGEQARRLVGHIETGDRVVVGHAPTLIAVFTKWFEIAALRAFNTAA